jgi:GNAT superfamily N-acetyltransferase
MMLTRALTKSDFDEIVRVIDMWWAGPTAALAHPIFFYELGQAARVVEINGRLVGFLLGFLTTDQPPVGYVHLIGVDPAYRRQGVARRLYESFEDNCRGAGCRRLKAITTVGNEVSRRFHEALGWRASIVNDYAGAGRHRMVFTKALSG